MVPHRLTVHGLRWTLLLPVAATLITSWLLITAYVQTHQYYGAHPGMGIDYPVNSYCPYVKSVAFLINGPFFWPLPLPRPIDVPETERIYSVCLGWFLVGMYLDWKRNHPFDTLINKRVWRLAVFGILAMCFTGVTLDFTFDVLYSVPHPPLNVAWTLFLNNHFKTGLTMYIILFAWLVALDVWAVRNLYRVCTRPHGAEGA